MYISFTFLLAMPIIELTSIGTQITEAFAGLDRIREVMNMTTEDDEDARKPSMPHVEGTIDFEDVYFEYEKDVPVLKGVSFHSEAGKNDRSRRFIRFGEIHNIESRFKFHPAESRQDFN